MTMDRAYQYDHPDYAVTRYKNVHGALSASAASTAFIGSTLGVFEKCMVYGLSFLVASVGSAPGAETCFIRRSTSALQSFICTIAAAGNIFDLSLTSAWTMHSVGECFSLCIGSGTLADKGFVIGTLAWRYRLIPGSPDPVT